MLPYPPGALRDFQPIGSGSPSRPPRHRRGGTAAASGNYAPFGFWRDPRDDAFDGAAPGGPVFMTR
jgi:hypothetical protein